MCAGKLRSRHNLMARGSGTFVFLFVVGHEISGESRGLWYEKKEEIICFWVTGLGRGEFLLSYLVWLQACSAGRLLVSRGSKQTDEVRLFVAGMLVTKMRSGSGEAY